MNTSRSRKIRSRQSSTCVRSRNSYRGIISYLSRLNHSTSPTLRLVEGLEICHGHSVSGVNLPQISLVCLVFLVLEVSSVKLERGVMMIFERG